MGEAATPAWLDSDGLHGYLLGRPVENSADRRRAIARYATLVADAAPDEAPIWREALQGQVYLGDDAFVARMQALATPGARAASEVPRAHRHAPLSLQDSLRHWPGQREQALRQAYREGGITMSAMAAELGLSVSRVSRLIARAEEEVGEGAKGKT